MFQFPRLPSSKEDGGPSSAGFPHSGTPGSKPECGSPGTIAASRALRRLPVPRHPPCALCAFPLPRGAPGTFKMPCLALPYETREKSLASCPKTASSDRSSSLCGSQGARGRAPRAVYRGRGGERGRRGRPPRRLPVLVLPRKEVIQPHLPVRLPCYDFTPLAPHTFGASAPCGFGRRLRVQTTRVV